MTVITNYSELQAEVINWLHRPEQTGNVTSWIALAENQFNRIIRTVDMETRSQATADNEFLGLPTDWMEIRELHIVDSTNYPLKYYTPQAFTYESRLGATGDPQIYTIVDDQIRLFPAPSATSTFNFEITYLQRIPALSDTNTTNWLLDDNADVYLYGALVRAEPFLINDNRVPMWKAMLAESINELNVASGKTRVGAGPLAPRVRNVV
tara:strand:+ start:5949 stop:6575 length:627 start_codon:yes stop_codon:yes gene_type:complete